MAEKDDKGEGEREEERKFEGENVAGVEFTSFDELKVNRLKQALKVLILWFFLSIPVPIIVFFVDVITSGMLSSLFLRTILLIATHYPKLRLYIPMVARYNLQLFTSRSFIVTRALEKIGVDAASLNLVLYLVVFLLAFLFTILLTYFLSARILRRWYKAKKLENVNLQNDLAPELEKIVEELSKKYGVKKPEVYIGEFDPNAFILGRKPSLVLSRKLLELLDRDEVEAVIAFQLLHTKRGTAVMTLTAFVAGLLTALSTLAYWVSLLTGFGLEDDPAPNLIKLYVMSVVAPISALIVRFMMPYRRSKVFSTFLNTYGEPEKLVNAVDKIKKSSGEFDLPQLSSQAINPGHWHLFLLTPEHKEVVNILDFHLPTYLPFFAESKPRRLRPFLYMSISHLFILFAIIAFDTFNRKDFDFLRASAITAVYLLFYITFVIVWAVYFRK
ncbi:hypothetical protein DRP07_04325 [Archaeoglobales archaeon]|nr:MAG: hypothetical protein DRP07_04325 [Archaeoglobales archaeon]